MIPQIKRILYATDLSPNSVYALRYAMNSAVKHDADIIILHVFEKVDPYLYEDRHQKIYNERISEGDRKSENLCLALPPSTSS